jgi:hypothetical protein
MKRDDGDKEYAVVVQRGTRQVTMPIIAKNAETAKALAARLLRRRGGKSTIVAATEKK